MGPSIKQNGKKQERYSRRKKQRVACREGRNKYNEKEMRISEFIALHRWNLKFFSLTVITELYFVK
jgi:hypothetical protein